MGFFTQQTKRAIIDNQHSVIVKKLTFGELSDATSAATVIDPNTSALRIDPIAFQKEIFARSVVEWFGPNFEDRPVTRENVLALPAEVARKIREVSDELNQEMDEEEGNESAAPTS